MVHPFPCAMMRWLEAREGMVSGCAEDDHCGPERGVVATRDLEADEEILRVPAALLLTAGSARACLGLPERMIALPEEDLIVLMILAESARGERSRWWFSCFFRQRSLALEKLPWRHCTARPTIS